MRYELACRILPAILAHVFATLLLSSRELRVRNGARHDRPSQQEDNEQQSKIDNKLHKRRTITTYGADIQNVHTYLIRSAQRKLQEKSLSSRRIARCLGVILVQEARTCCSAYLLASLDLRTHIRHSHPIKVSDGRWLLRKKKKVWVSGLI